MRPTLDEILDDGRLARLFTKDVRHCALQLWILQIKSQGVIENRIMYGRLLPYSYSNSCWSSTEDDNFQTIQQTQAQLVRLNLYVESACCTKLLRQLSAGRTISAISKELSLEISDKLNTRFGASALVADELVYRPVAYLLNRDAHDTGSPSSPHGGAGALSASITQIDKERLFRLDQDYDVALVKLVVQRLNVDTGLDFGGADTSRFGDLELLVFPTLDDLERPLLNVSWNTSPYALVVRFNSMQVSHFSRFQFRISIENDNQMVYSSVAIAERDTEGMFECRFGLSEQLSSRTDSTELDIFGYHDEHSITGTLCCRWRINYLREINIQGQVAGHNSNPVKFDWLKKTTQPSASVRVENALTINRGKIGFNSRIGEREADPWVPANRDLTNLFLRLYPSKSEGQFFPRWGQSNGEGRLQFVEWFKNMLAKYSKHQIVIFDPYFEDAGLGLILLCSQSDANYIVFRSMPKPLKEMEANVVDIDRPASKGIDNLLANCEHNRSLLSRFKLCIYGLKDGRLHDRYILITGRDGLPIAGFNLSNSFQKASENYPLLVTPIPADVLLTVEQYKSELVHEACAARSEDNTEDPSLRLLFDSTAPLTALRRFEQLRFLEDSQAGNVLSIWTGEPLLRNLSGDPLRERMALLNLLEDSHLKLPETAGLRNYLNQETGDFTDFSKAWLVLGEVLAHSSTRDSRLLEFKSVDGFLRLLARFLETSFNRAPDQVEKELVVADIRLFQKSTEDLLHSSYRPHHLSHPTKYAALNWPEYFAIRILWWYAPGTLLLIAESQIPDVLTEAEGQDALRLSLLSQIISEISLSVQFDISEEQRDLLVHSSNGLLQWMGLNAIEAQLEEPGGLALVLRLVAAFSYPEQVRALGWMVQHAAGNTTKIETYKGLVVALHEALPTTLPTIELRRLVNSMRGHMQQLVWAEPWLFQDVVYPLLKNDRVNIDDACEIWIQELITLLKPETSQQSWLFDIAREGQTTTTTAFLFAYSSFKQQQASLKLMKALLKRQQRIIQQPLASTSDWARWNGALIVSMWMLTFTLWCQYYMRGRGMTDTELSRFSQTARDLAMVRPMSEWRPRGAGTQGELAAFLDQVEKILASSSNLEGEGRQ